MVQPSKPKITILRGEILYFTGDPDLHGAASYQHIKEGMVVIDGGQVREIGEISQIESLTAINAEVFNYPDCIIMPGFIDTHIHYPQTDIIASHGEQLLTWLEKYTFPAEVRFRDPEVACDTAEFFLDQLLRSGTTCASVYGTVHPQSVDAFFTVSQKRNTRMICGKVMMDRNAPEELCDTAESSYQDSKTLIERWHGEGRQHYAVTPRFAVTSTEAQLSQAGALLSEYPDLYLQTHLAENQQELALVAELFPQAKNYLDVYDQFGLLGPRSLFGHGIYLSQEELVRLADTQSGVAFCPSSNLFLGSGLFNLTKLRNAGVRTSLATDVGAGTSFSMLHTMADAYKISRLSGWPFSPLKAFYMATLGNARALSLDLKVGSLEVGQDADVVIINKKSTALLERRLERCNDLEEMLFALMVLGDDRAVKATWVAGKCLYEN